VGASSTAGGQTHAALWNTRPQTPSEQIATLREGVTSLATAGKLNHGQAQSLLAKLDAASGQLDKANKSSANLLGAFINHVQAFVTSGIMSESDGQMLIDPAQDLMNQLRT
jgi:hypothetical protein